MDQNDTPPNSRGPKRGEAGWGDSGRSEDWTSNQRYGERKDWDHESSYGTDWEEGDDQNLWEYDETQGEVPGPHVGKGPRGYQPGSDPIYEEICGRMTQHGRLDASRIHVSVENGAVTLTGEVEARGDERLAESIASSVAGVSEVHNRLRIPDLQGAAEESNAPNRDAMTSGQSGPGSPNVGHMGTTEKGN